MKRYVFDIETLKTADEVGGWKNKHCMGVAVLCVMDFDSGEEFVFSDDYPGALPLDGVGGFVDNSVLMGHNIRCFDLRLVQQILLDRGEDPHLAVGTLDTGTRRISLGSMSEATFGTHKQMDGALAPLEWRNGPVAKKKVVDYCKDDVNKTSELIKFGIDKGYVFYFTKEGIKKTLMVDWKKQLDDIRLEVLYPWCLGQFRVAKKNWQCARCASKVLCKERSGVEL